MGAGTSGALLRLALRERLVDAFEVTHVDMTYTGPEATAGERTIPEWTCDDQARP